MRYADELTPEASFNVHPALANEIPPLWQLSPRLSLNYVRVTDVLLPLLRELVAEVIASRRLDDSSASADTGARLAKQGLGTKL